MKRKKIILAIVLCLIAGGAWYGYREYTRSNKDLSNVKPDFILSATALLQEFAANDSAASHKYNGQAVEISGMVKEVNKDEKGFFTIILGDTVGLSTVRCSMDTVHQNEVAVVRTGEIRTLRGACTGYYKDELGLGSDVILNFCVIVPESKKP